jgi:hypothetical protein
MLSSTGNEVAFVSGASNLLPGDTNSLADIFARSLFPPGVVRRYSVDSSGNQAGGAFGHSRNPDVAGQGKVVVYESSANNLVAGDTNSMMDVFETLSRGPFQRGDANANGNVGEPTTDAIVLCNFLFLGGPPPPCFDAADANDDGRVDISDCQVIPGGGPFPPPGNACGLESTGEALTCCVHVCQ